MVKGYPLSDSHGNAGSDWLAGQYKYRVIHLNGIIATCCFACDWFPDSEQAKTSADTLGKCCFEYWLVQGRPIHNVDHSLPDRS